MSTDKDGESETRSGVGAGLNSRPLNDTVAQTGPGIPDDSASPGYDPEADTEMERKAEADLPSAEDLFRKP